MASAPAPAAARRVRATVLFADVSGFAAVADRLGVERAYAVVTGALRVLDGVLRRHGGSVDKYLGDSLMAVFGHPVPSDRAASSAIAAALEMREGLAEVDREAGLGGLLGLVVGINTGPMIAGPVGSGVIREFHVLGDAVNTAARIESKAPVGAIYVGPETAAEAGADFELRALAPMPMKGKSRPVPVFEVVGERPGARRAGALEGATRRIHGRAGELARSGERLAALGRGEGGVIVISGPEGIGRSRLLDEVAARAHAAGASVVSLAAAPGHGGDALHVFAPLLAEADDDPARRAVLAEAAVRGRCEEGPTVVCADDVQIADGASVTLLAELATLAGERPLLVVATAQTDGSGGLPPAAETLLHAAGARGETLALSPLDRAASRALVDELAGETPLSEEERELVLARGAGLPARLVLATHLAPALVSEAERAEDVEDRSDETERRRATVLFADITGFTAMSEKMDPAEAYPIVAGCLALLDEIASRHGGTVDKYLGDCVLAFFGVPRAMEDAPRAAVNAAIEMVGAVRRYSRERGLAHPLDVHIGVATGLGIAGDISGPLLREFAVMGDAVDLADALTDAAERGQIFVSEETVRATGDDFEYRPLPPLEVKGHPHPAPCFELLSREQHLRRAQRKIFSSLVGREEELARLEAVLDALRAGRGGVASVVGEAGLGKTRLVAELRARSGDDVRWVAGCSLSNGRHMSFHPFAELFRSWVGIEDEDDDTRAREKLRAGIERTAADRVDELYPLLGSMLGLPLLEAERARLERIPPDALPRLLRAAVARLIRGGTKRRPIVAVMDDLHWADQSSVELLESLLPLAGTERILFLNVMRPDFPSTSGRICEAARKQLGERYVEIALAPLDAAAARRLVKNLFGGDDVPHRLRTLIEERARGNPFYIEEVFRALLDEGAIEHRDGRFVATPKLETVELPGTVQELVMARVDRLPRRRRRVLQIASVIGQSFHRDVLAAVDGAPGDLDDAIEALLDAEFLVPSDRLPGLEYAFKHPLLQEVSYASLTEARREELHLAVAEAMEDRLAPDLPGYEAMLAYHYGKGRDAERAEAHLFRAGDDAARVSAASEALEFFREATRLYLELHADGGDPAKRALLEKKLALALYHKGHLIEADAHFNEALRLLGERVPGSDRALLARFARDALSVLTGLRKPLRRGSRRPASDVDREVIDLMMRRAEAQTTASPRRFLFDSLATLARLNRVDPTTVPGAGGMYAGCVGIFSYGGLSFGLGQRFLDRAAELVSPERADEYMFFRVMRFLHHLLAGDWDDAFELPDEALEEAVRDGRLWPATQYLNLDAVKRIYRGQLDRAWERIERLSKIGELYQYDLAASAAQALIAYVHLEARDLDRARKAIETYYDEHPEAAFRVVALGTWAKADLLAGDAESAERHLELAERYMAEAGRVLPYHASGYHVARVAVDVARLGEAVAAGNGAVREARQRARRSHRAAATVCAKVAWRRPELHRLDGLRLWLGGDRRGAIREWSRGLALCEKLGTLPEHARTLRELGTRLAGVTERERPAGAPDPDACLVRAERELRQLGIPC